MSRPLIAAATAPAMSASTTKRSASRRSYDSPHMCSPSEARTSSTVTRSRSPARRTLPVTNCAMRRARAAASGSTPLFRKRCTAARDFTASRWCCPSRPISSSVSPSARYASAVSGDRLSKYSTATLLGAGAVEAWDVRRHGGVEPSGHWAWRPLYDARTLSCTTRVSARSALGPPSTALDPLDRWSSRPRLLHEALEAGVGADRVELGCPQLRPNPHAARHVLQKIEGPVVLAHRHEGRPE